MPGTAQMTDNGHDAPNPQRATLIGQTVGSYRIEEHLGRGGMGEVYRGVHRFLGRASAIKVLHPLLAADPTVQERFRHEARAAARLTHPNIVLVHDFGQQDGLLYLVMELMQDGSLGALLKREAGIGRTLPLAQAIDLIRQAANGLAHAHAAGVVHRDVKPDNLLLKLLDSSSPEQPEYRVKVCDFSLARLAEEIRLTMAGTVVGTPAYMAPEQLLGRAVDGRTDLYGLGLVLYQVVTGQHPFKIRTPVDATFQHLHVDPAPPRELRPDLPGGLDEIILRCLAKQPDERYQTALELSQALGDVLRGLGVATHDEAFQPIARLVSDPDLPVSRLVTDSTVSARRTATPPGMPRPATTTSTPLTPSSTPQSDTERIRIEVESDRLRITTGEPTSQRVRVTNLGDDADRVSLWVSGVPRSWVRTPELGVPLQPRAWKTISLPVNVPVQAVSEPGVYAVRISARSQERHEEVEASALWEVLVPTGGPGESLGGIDDG
jgi:serine/threonine protein kinase